MNVIDSAIDAGVKKVVALSTDKASSPINLYGASKLASDKLFVAGNSYSGEHGTQFSVVRYGNVMGSRGSVIPLFLSLKNSGKFTITDKRMTRFMITLEQGVSLVWHAFETMLGGEIYVKKIPSMNIMDIAKAIDPSSDFEFIGVRPGEKLHEQMIGVDDAPFTYEFTDHFRILPQINDWYLDSDRIASGTKVANGFEYNSNNNKDWMQVEFLRKWISDHANVIGNF